MARKRPESPGASRGTLLHRAAFEGIGLEELSRYDLEAVERVRAVVEREAEDAEERLVETRVVVDGLTWGTVDLAWRRGLEAGLVDAKFHPTGEPDEAAMREQGVAYALGLLERWPIVTRVSVVFIAPHGELEFRFALTRERYKEHRARLERAIARAERADSGDPSQYTVGPWCEYCPALLCCRAMQDASFGV